MTTQLLNCKPCMQDKHDECKNPETCRCANDNHGVREPSLKDGVRVSKTKSDKDTLKEFNDATNKILDDSELKQKLRLQWQIIKSDKTEFDEKQVARQTMNEVLELLGKEKKIWLSDEKQKEYDDSWIILKSKRNSGVKKVDKDKAKKRIDELQEELGEDLYFDDEFGDTWLDYAHLIMNEDHFLTLDDSDEILFYSKGKYHDGGEKRAIKILFEFNPYLETKSVREIIAIIKKSTWIPRDEFDRNSEEFCLENKIVDVRTGNISEHSYKKLFRVQLPIKYDKNARCPKFIKFMLQCLPNPYDYIVVMEEFASCLMKNIISFQQMYFHTGNGDNGKSLFFHIIEWFLGEGLYSSEPFHKLIKDKHSPANLENKLVNIYADIVSDAIDNINSMKPIVSGDTINAEFKYHTAHPFVNFARMFFSANELPEIEEKTFSALKRIRLTKWEQKFLRKSEYDKELENLKLIYSELSDDELKKELGRNGIHLMDKQFLKTITSDEKERQGILNVLLGMCGEMIKRDGFLYDQDMDNLKEMWSENSTAIEKYVNECIVSDPNGHIDKGRLHTLYTKYSTEITGQPPRANNVFHKQVKKLLHVEEGFKRKHGIEHRIYLGISWNFDNSFIRKYERNSQKSKSKKNQNNSTLI